MDQKCTNWVCIANCYLPASLYRTEDCDWRHSVVSVVSIMTYSGRVLSYIFNFSTCCRQSL